MSRLLALGLALIAGGVLAIYFLNRPGPDTYPDSSTYLREADWLLQGRIFSVDRLPGYPALLAVLAGTRGSLGPVMAVQAVMFVVCTVLTYQIVVMTFGRKWIALLAGLMVATDVFAAAYAKAILSETLATTFITAMAATSVAFTLKPRPALVWLMALLATLAALTRPEWVFFPLVLTAYLGSLALRRGREHRQFRHGLAALASCYLVIGGYIAGNAITNGFIGTTDVTNVSLLGKVMEYRMEGEAPASMASAAAIVGEYERAGKSPWDVVGDHPEFAKDHYAAAGAFARSVITRDPLRFARMSIDDALLQSATFDPQFATITREGPLAHVLQALEVAAGARYFVLFLVPVTGLVWLIVPLARRRADALDGLGPVALVALYGTSITALGGFDEFGRYHVVFITASVALVWGTLGLNAQIAWSAFSTNRLIGLGAVALLMVELAASARGRRPGSEVLWFIAQPDFRLVLATTLVVAQGVLLRLAFSAKVLALPPRPEPAR